MSQEKLKDSYIDISDNFDIAWKIFLSNRQELLWLLLVINVPLAIISEFIPQPSAEAQSSATLFYSAMFAIISGILGILLNLAIAMITEKTVLGEEITAQSALKQGIPKILIAFVMGILLFIMLTIGYILLIVPGIYLSIIFAFFMQAIALRNCKFRAFSYSQNLVKGQFWRVFGRLLLLGIALFLLSLALIIPQTFLSILLLPVPILKSALAISLNAIFGLINYLFIITLTVYFLNLDYLKNGLPRRA